MCSAASLNSSRRVFATYRSSRVYGNSEATEVRKETEELRLLFLLSSWNVLLFYDKRHYRNHYLRLSVVQAQQKDGWEEASAGQCVKQTKRVILFLLSCPDLSGSSGSLQNSTTRNLRCSRDEREDHHIGSARPSSSHSTLHTTVSTCVYTDYSIVIIVKWNKYFLFGYGEEVLGH